MKKFILAFLFMVCPFAAQANEDSGLYNLPPPNASFVRQVNPCTKSAESIPAFKVTDYKIYTSNKFKDHDGNTHNLAKNTYYTYTVDCIKGGQLHEDKKGNDPTKARVQIYNLSKENAISLKAQNGKISVIENIEPFTTGHRDINPLPVTFSVYKSGKKIKDLPEVTLENRAHYTVFYIDEDHIELKRGSIAE